MNFELLKILLFEKTLLKFMLGVILSFSFSMAVILGTVGLMDGFDFSMKEFMKRSTGDLLLFSQDGFFKINHDTKKVFKEHKITEITNWIKTEGFVISKENTKGVVIRGIEPESFYKVTNLKVDLLPGEIIIGDELAAFLQAKVGDNVVLAFASGNENLSGLSLLKTFRLKEIIHHGLYREDMRFIYLHLDELQSILKVGDKVNIVSFNIPNNGSFTFAKNPKEYLEKIESVQDEIISNVGVGFKVWPFWQQFTTLFEAVKVQKFMIGLILQLIVITSIFNMVAFIIYINNQKSKEIFLLGALGMSQRGIKKIWWVILKVVWGISCLFSILFVQIFAKLLTELSFLKMPGQIYYMSRFNLRIGFIEYALVFLLAFIWLKVIFAFSFRKLQKNSILSGLKKEFV